MNDHEPEGVLLLYYGAPRDLAEIEPFLHRVTGGRPLPPPAVEEYRRRYLRIGGRSPLPGIVDALASALKRRLDEQRPGESHRVAVGTLFGSPTIAEAVAELAARPIRRVVAVTLVPQYSPASVGRYAARLEAEVAAAGHPFRPTFVRSWATHPLLVEAFAQRLRAALALLPDSGASASVVFTAHSLPVAAVPEGDPYEAELRATAAAVADRVGVAGWQLAYQSAGRAGGPWIGPSVGEMVERLAATNRAPVVLVPIHFLADNVEILYDLDVVLKERAAALGVRVERVESLNASPLLVAALADVVRRPPSTL